MSGITVNRKCKYCRRNLVEIKTMAWFKEIWKKSVPVTVCPYCDRIGGDEQ